MNRVRRLTWLFAVAAACMSAHAWASPPVATVSTAGAATDARTSPAAGGGTQAPSASSPGSVAAPPMPKKLLQGAALEAAVRTLGSANPSEVRQGLLALAGLSGDAPARALAARLRKGLPPGLIGDAIDAAVKIGSARVAPELLELTLHKRPPIRQKALTALAALHVKSAQDAMLAALDDLDADVRRAAIDALAAIGSARALPALLALVDRGQPGALEAVGKLAGPRDLSALLGRVEGGDITPMRPALQALVMRKQVAFGVQLAVVGAVAKLGSPSARSCLVEWLDAWKITGHPLVRKALFDAIKRIDRASPQDAVAATTITNTVVQGTKLAAGPATFVRPQSGSAASPRRVAPSQEALARAESPAVSVKPQVSATPSDAPPSGGAR